MNETQRIQENSEKLVKTISGSGFGMKPNSKVTEHAPEIAKQLLEGKTSFIISGTSFLDNDWVDYQLNFGLSKKPNSPTVYYQGVYAEMYKDIKVPNQPLEGFNLLALETKMQAPIAGLAAADLKKQVASINNEMKMLMEKSPDVFNALVVKYNPKLEFQIPEPLLKSQNALDADHKKYNYFSNYYNLTPLEIYGMLNGRSANKDLFRTKSAPKEVEGAEVNASDKRFNTWLRINFKQTLEDGSHPIDLISSKNYNIQKELGYYNFLELRTPAGRLGVEEALKKASQVLANNMNNTGERKLLIEAFPEYKSFLFHRMDGSHISRHSHNDYQKVQLDKHIGAVTEFTPSGQVEKKSPPVNETTQLQRRVFNKTRVVQPGTPGQGPGR